MPVKVQHVTGKGRGETALIGAKTLLLLASLPVGVRNPTSDDLVASELNYLIAAHPELSKVLPGDIVAAGNGPAALENLVNLADPLAEVKILESYRAKSDSIDQESFGKFCDAVCNLPKSQTPADASKALIQQGFTRNPLEMYGTAREAAAKYKLIVQIAKQHKINGTATQAIEATLVEVKTEVARRFEMLKEMVKSSRNTLSQAALIQQLSGGASRSSLPLVMGTGTLSVEDFLSTEATALQTTLSDNGIDDLVVIGGSVSDLAPATDIAVRMDRHFNIFTEVDVSPGTAVSRMGNLEHTESQSRIIASIGCGDGASAAALYAHRLFLDRRLIIKNNPAEDRFGLFEPQEAHAISGLTGNESFVLPIGRQQQEALTKAGFNVLVKTKSGVFATSLVTRCARADLRLGVPVRASGIGQAMVAEELGGLWQGKYSRKEQLDAGVDSAMRFFEPYNLSKIIVIKASAEMGLDSGQVIFSVEYGLPGVITEVILRRVINHRAN
jgi:hypothetical protein